MGVKLFQQAISLGIAEVTGAPIPRERLLLIALTTTNGGTLKEGRIERHPHPQCRVPISHLGGVLIKEPGRSEVAHA